MDVAHGSRRIARGDRGNGVAVGICAQKVWRRYAPQANRPR